MVQKMKITEEFISFIYSYSLYKENDYQVLGCAGLRPLWGGAYEGWIHSKDFHTFNRHKIFVIRFIVKYLKFIMDQPDTRRIQAVIHSEDVRARAFVRFLGFKAEGVMKKYGPDGSNFIMYARVK